MAKFKVLETFNVKADNEKYTKGDVVDITVKRADELNKRLEDKHGVTGLERVEEEKE